ncbi:hypothetical protein N7445_001738 [Penicillium cf. griseofulvum]|nr:hypothetical protein N7445_001738 [Penicillium cf. griseofulvum]
MSRLKSSTRLNPATPIKISKSASNDLITCLTPVLPMNTQSPNPKPSNEHKPRSQRQSLSYITSPPHPGIKHNVNPLSNSLRNPLKRIKTSNSPINLPPSMITHNNSLNTMLNTPPRITN